MMNKRTLSVFAALALIMSIPLCCYAGDTVLEVSGNDISVTQTVGMTVSFTVEDSYRLAIPPDRGWEATGKVYSISLGEGAEYIVSCPEEAESGKVTVIRSVTECPGSGPEGLGAAEAKRIRKTKPRAAVRGIFIALPRVRRSVAQGLMSGSGRSRRAL